MFDDNFSWRNLISLIKPKTVGFLVLVVAGLGVTFYGLIDVVATGQVEPDEQCLSQLDSEILSILPDDSIQVDVNGAVEEPGVYKLSLGQRIGDAVKLAGGFSIEADKVQIGKHLNLAQKVEDGDKIYVPFAGEKDEAKDRTTESKSEQAADGERKVSINEASKNDLESLPGIGEKRASEIIENRPYLSLNELVSREVLTETITEKIKPLISL